METRNGGRCRVLCAALLASLTALACGGGGGGYGGLVPQPSGASPAPVAKACDATLAGITLDDAQIRKVEAVEAGPFTPPGATATISLPAFCRVQGVSTPSSDSMINFELWIPPAAAWNGKLLATGNGGYSPALSFNDMANGLRRGYAALGGDTGHQSANPNDMLFGVNHPQKIIDWGSRSIHAITVAGKRIVAELQGKAATRAYYYGCSTGGHQGYAEVQRYPDDFDGVIAGAPGNNRTRLNVGFLWQFLSNRNSNDNATLIIPAAKLPLITNAVVAACDANDGVTDGVVDDPRSCTFDPAVLQCSGADAPNCLTTAQLGALAKMYAGPRNPRTGEQIYPGWPKSSEALVSNGSTPLVGWHSYWGLTEPTRADYWRYWVFDNPQWNWWSFDFDRDLAYADAKVGLMVDQNSTDIGAFKSRGGKLIVYNGWQDPVVNPIDTIAYFDKVKARQGSQAEMDKFFRLFLVPGMGHCSGGTGATSFGNSGAAPIVDADHDLLEALDRWVDRSIAPDRLIASRVAGSAVNRTRPLCPYPKKAVYQGSGSTDDAASFSCQ